MRYYERFMWLYAIATVAVMAGIIFEEQIDAQMQTCLDDPDAYIQGELTYNCTEVHQRQNVSYKLETTWWNRAMDEVRMR